MSPGAVVAIVTTLETVGAMASSAHAPLAPFLKRDLALTDTQVGLLTTAVYFGGFISGLPAGALGDRLGVRLMFVLTQVPFGLLVLLAPHMPSYAWLFAVLLGAGLGYGCLSPQTAKAVVTWAPAGRRATMMGIKQMGITLGSALGASILPALALWAGWRAGYRLAGAAVVTAALVAYAVYRQERPADAAATGRAVAAWRDVLADRGIVMTSVVALVFAGFQLAAGTFFALYLHAAFGLDAVRAAAYLALAQYVGTAARLGWGVASDRVFGGRRRGIIAFQGFVAALIGFALGLAPRLPGWLLPVLAVALGASLMGWNGLYMTLVAELAGPERAGLASGYSLVLTRLGIMVASPVFGYIADATGGYRASWLAFAALTLAVSCAFAVSRFAEPAARARAAAT